MKLSVRGKTVLFATAMAAVLALFILLSAIEHPPRMPGDGDHKAHALEASCLECHGPAGIKPFNKHHTSRPSCHKCHQPR